MKIPSDIVSHKKSRELELIYDDGEVARLSFEYLRVMSPSAEVKGHTPGEAVLQVGKRLVEIVAIEPVGSYAVTITFSDGHNTGIYSWDYFRELIAHREEWWNEYLSDLAKADASREPGDPANKPFEPKPQKNCSHR